MTRGAPELVSVVLPVRDAEAWLGDQLAALAAQTYAGSWEVVVVDNGCRDGSREVLDGWTDRLPALRVVEAHGRRSLNHARNMGARAARGDFLAFCDADDVVFPNWLEALAAAAPTADLVGGTFDIEALNPPLLQAWRPDEPLTELPMEHGLMPYVPGGNCGIWADVARDVGWDESFAFGSSEIEFCWRAQVASYTLAFAPDAVVRLRYRRTLPALARQYRAYGSSGALLYRRFRAAGMRRDTRDALGWWKWLLRRSPDVLRSRERRGRWVRVAAFRCGRVAGSLRARTLFL